MPKNKSYMQNRELSWLKFNERVMDEANDETVPLLERLRFLSIFTTNLDEFYRVRVGSLIDMAPLKEKARDSRSGMTPDEQLKAIYAETQKLYEKRDIIFFDLMKQLKNQKIEYCTFDMLKPDEKVYAENYFSTKIMPILTPQIIDKLHPFPQIQNKVSAIGVILKSAKGKSVPALLTMPPGLDTVFYFPGNGIRFTTMDELLYEFADVAFSTYTVSEKVKLCVTRNADIQAEDEDLEMSENFQELMIKMLKDRRHLSPLRLELSEEVSADTLKFLTHILHIQKSQVFISKIPFDLRFAYSLEDKLNPKQKSELLYTHYEPRIPKTIQNTSMFTQLKNNDILLSYPYESMDPFLRLVEEAANDENVLSIQITIYRLAKKSRLVNALCQASDHGKEVTVLMELRARFDEQNNIDWSNVLEKAGCQIIYGTPDYKVHSKLCLITRKEKEGYCYYTQVGTGNYNEKTAQLYTDLCLMTSNQTIGKESSLFFRNMGIGNLSGEYHTLLVSPVNLKKNVIALIERETKKKEQGYLFFKMNSLTDKDIIIALHNASKAGVRIQMVIRGICCLLPNIAHETDHIEVHSIVGRYLEHSRIYIFGKGDEEKMYIASADFMTRNTERRVEVGCPVYSKTVKTKIHTIVNLLWSDAIKGRIILADGSYGMIQPSNQEIARHPVNAQLAQMELAENTGLTKEEMEEKKDDKTSWNTSSRPYKEVKNKSKPNWLIRLLFHR